MKESTSLIAKARSCRAALPFDPIPALLLGMIELAILEAWKELVGNQQEYRVNILQDAEHKISQPLVCALNFLRNNAQRDPFKTLLKHFESAYVGAGFQNYRGEEIQQPDIVFRPRVLRHAGIDAEYFALFVEAKVISDLSHQTVGEYFREGVVRFLDGRYAWAMSHGLMLAYVRGSKVEAGPSICTYLRSRDHRTRFDVLSDDVPVLPPNLSPNVHQTVHARTWEYDGNRGRPGDIEIRHLWLSVYV